MIILGKLVHGPLCRAVMSCRYVVPLCRAVMSCRYVVPFCRAAAADACTRRRRRRNKEINNRTINTTTTTFIAPDKSRGEILIEYNDVGREEENGRVIIYCRRTYVPYLTHRIH